MSGSLFYDLGQLDQIAVNLFYGWGYNFYRLENQLRADDLMVRARVSFLLGAARSHLETAQSEFRRKFIRPPSREKPRPDADAIDNVERLEELSRLTGQLEGNIRALPVPETDRMTQRYRQEAQTLVTLREYDSHMVGRAQVLLQMVENQDHASILSNYATLKEGLTMMQTDLTNRQRLLQ